MLVLILESILFAIVFNFVWDKTANFLGTIIQGENEKLIPLILFCLYLALR
jgi:hypothetical protein